MALTPQKCVLEQKPQLLTSLKFGSPVFRVLMEMENWCLAIMKNQKNGSNSPKMHPRAKVPITDPPKVRVSGFLSVDGNEKLVSGIMKNQKNASNSPARTYVFARAC